MWKDTRKHVVGIGRVKELMLGLPLKGNLSCYICRWEETAVVRINIWKETDALMINSWKETALLRINSWKETAAVRINSWKETALVRIGCWKEVVLLGLTAKRKLLLQGYTALRETDFRVGRWMETARILRTYRPLETTATVKLQFLCWKTVVFAFCENDNRTLFFGTLL
jgi:hypothetical protein